MLNALDWLLRKPASANKSVMPNLVISAGFSGALQDGLQIGDIILATEVVDEQGDRWSASWPGELTEKSQPLLHRGRLLTVSRFVTDPEEKRSLGRRHDALALDMETATVARMCSQANVPFGCIRAISDDSRTPLSPHLDALIVNGRVSPWRLVSSLLRRPRLAAELWRLARQTRLASVRLGRALGELLTLTLPWAADS